MAQVAMEGIMEGAQAITVSNDDRTTKVTISFPVHPVEYSKIVEIAQNTGMPESEFMALAMHRGVCEMEREHGDDDVWSKLRSARRQ